MSFIHVREQDQEGPQEEEEHEDSPNLCQRCKELDLDRIFNGPCPSEYSERVLTLGILDKDSPCGLCRFFYSMRRSSLGGLYHLRKWRSNMSGIPGLCPDPGDSTLWAVDLHEVSRDSTRRVVGSHLHLFENDRPYSCFLPQSTKPCLCPGETLEGLPVFETTVNYPLLRHWIKECEGHPTCSSDLSNPRTGPTIRVIDCKTRRIVDLGPGDRYIALSYVWGNKPLLENKGSRVLPTNTPKVVEDAMVVVKELGQQYLWVDQYCINQHDDRDKDAQIKNMDRIYEGSHATIVAYSGADSSSGLPGVSSTPRIPQHRFTSSKLTLLGCELSITGESFGASIWSKRGWTFQEALLSRRSLIFTQEQVYFLCSRGWWVESCTPTPHMTCLFERDTWKHSPLLHQSQEAMRSISPLTRSPSQNPVLRVKVDYPFFRRLLERFTRRQLSFQSDALDAVRGLLSRVPVLTYWGVPVYDFVENRKGGFTLDALKANAVFLSCIYWQPNVTATDAEYLGRREGFPSWSWLGWRIPINFGYYGDMPSESIRSTVKVENDDGTLLSISDLVELYGAEVERSRMLPERTTYLWLEGLVLTLGFQPIRNRHEGGIYFCFEYPLGYPDHMECRCSSWNLHLGARVDFRLNIKGSREMLEKTLKKRWSCLLILNTRSERWEYIFLILDEGDDAAYCVGTLWLQDTKEEGNLLEKLKAKVPHEYRKVRIG